MTLLSHLSCNGSGLPLPADARRLALSFAGWDEALARAGEDAAAARDWSATPAGKRLLAAMFGNSPFLAAIAIKEWAFLTDLVRDGPDPLLSRLIAAAEQAENGGEDAAALMRRLRIAKRRVALLAAVAELTTFWSLERQTEALSLFAEASLGAAVRHALRAAAAKRQIAVDMAEPERVSGLIVLGMGKLGGRELNYSSDIDLILLFDPAVASVSARDGPQPFFNRLARDVVRLLDERTSDGYVFRTDLRLRPDPRSTPLAMSVPAALTYYEGVGQNWERAALIKARPVAGDRSAGERFLAELRPFIWRKSLDFAAIQDIHSIKRQINAHKGGGRIAVAGHNIKTGRGGIREIEFFAQTQQLIWGGRLRELRVAPTCEALRRLAAAGRIDEETASSLIECYRFLRRVEHRLQMIEDAQTHTLPSDAAGIASLATFLGCADTAGFTAELCGVLGRVEHHYAELFEEAPSLAGPGNLVFTGADDDRETLDTLAALGFADPPAVAALVRGWHHGRWRATRTQRAREILTELVPALLRIFGASGQPDTALRRFDQFLSRLPAGVQLFSLFYANPGLLALVADIMAEAPPLAEILAQKPALLDAVLTGGFSEPPPDRAGLAADLTALLGGARDFQDTLDILRRWAAERRFQVGVQLLHRRLDGTRSGAALADIAEAALGALLPAVEAEFAREHGRVAGGALAILGMGRLGSREMSLASDLDLILVYDADDGDRSDGRRALPVATYYARLSQRLIGAVTAPTGEGRLYDVDMRLRPSGDAGPIASSIAGLLRYELEDAWTWEHMALTRARPVAGDPALCAKLGAAVERVLRMQRDPARLVVDVAEMRRRIAERHPKPSPWDLRNRPGGLIDLEFTLQYLMLRDAWRGPAIVPRGIGEAIAALGEAGSLPPQACRELGEAATLLRHVQALLALLCQGVPQPTDLAGLVGVALTRCAGAIDFGRLDADITDAAVQVRRWYERLVAAPAREAAARGNRGTGGKPA